MPQLVLVLSLDWHGSQSYPIDGYAHPCCSLQIVYWFVGFQSNAAGFFVIYLAIFLFQVISEGRLMPPVWGITLQTRVGEGGDISSRVSVVASSQAPCPSAGCCLTSTLTLSAASRWAWGLE